MLDDVIIINGNIGCAATNIHQGNPGFNFIFS